MSNDDPMSNDTSMSDASPLPFTAELGGSTTRFDASRNSFSLPSPMLTNEERLHFEIGDSFFTQNWVTAPASTKARDGLGPTFNAQACASCHVLDGRGAPPDPADTDSAGNSTTGNRNRAALGLLLRLSAPGETTTALGETTATPTENTNTPGENTNTTTPGETTTALGDTTNTTTPGETTTTGAPAPLDGYGGQLQDRAVLGVPPEGKVKVSYTTVSGTYGDGTPFELRKPHFEIVDAAFGPIPDGALIGPRLAPQVIGMGLLEAVPADAILAGADPLDADGDGISGRANFVWSVSEGRQSLGRFGWKANTATVDDQVAGAFTYADIGITSSLHPDENCPEPQSACAAAPDGSEEASDTGKIPPDGTGDAPDGETIPSDGSGKIPEITDSRFDAVSFYIRTLAVPAMRDPDDPFTQAGGELFLDIGCASCHTSTLTTGPSDIATLAEQTIHPFTDLLLHDMGEGLADGRPDFLASGREWRTPPLWGVGLIDEINGERFLLHDGRARTLEEAILWHGGEAEASKEAFRLAEKSDREALIAFLEAL